MPNIDVIRPADPEETAGAFVAAMQRTDGPTLLALTRQTVPMLNDIDVNLRREGVLRGGYIAKQETGKLDLIILSCGSELQHALAAAKELGDGVRVVSMPCFERFNRQPQEYREEVLPNECRKRVAIEAGVTEIWYRICRSRRKSRRTAPIRPERPGPEVMKERGIDAQHVIEAAKSLTVEATGLNRLLRLRRRRRQAVRGRATAPYPRTLLLVRSRCGRESSKR